MSFFPFMVAGLLALTAVMWWRLDDPSSRPKRELCVPPYQIEWRKWEPDCFEKARLEGKVVWLNFKADWGLISQVNEARVLGDPLVREKLTQHEVIMIKADHTSRDPAIAAELKRFGRFSIPTDILAPADPNAEWVILPELLGPKVFLKGLAEVVAAGK